MWEDVQAIEALIYRYAQLQDRTDLAAVAELFRHGAFVVDKVPQPFRGTEQVRSMKQTHDRMYPDGSLRTKHVTTNVMVEIDGPDRASARSYFVVYQQTDELALQPIMAGRYHDTFVRVEGTWWFLERLVLTDLIGDLSAHTVDNPMVTVD